MPFADPTVGGVGTEQPNSVYPRPLSFGS
jgi:hypothetical protein